MEKFRGESDLNGYEADDRSLDIFKHVLSEMVTT